LTVELDRRPGEDAPRVTIKRFQPLDALAKRARLQMTVRLDNLASVASIAGTLASAHGGNGMLRLIVPISHDREAILLVGRDFTLDAELAARIERITGEGSVDLAVQEGPKLALVG
jgi:DNA polymerase III subunit alpha